MLTKIIITILIIVSVMFYLRKKNQTSSKSKHIKTSVPSQVKYLTFGFVALSLSLCLSAAYIFMQWKDDNKVVNVTIISPTSINEQSYLVRKKISL